MDAQTLLPCLSDAGPKPYADIAYHNEELRSLTRYRFDRVEERATLKSSISRLACILFPELEKLVPCFILPLFTSYWRNSRHKQAATNGTWHWRSENTAKSPSHYHHLPHGFPYDRHDPDWGRDFDRYESSYKLFVTLTYQSGQLKICYHPYIEKRDFRYLRYILYNANKYTSLWDLTFTAYLSKKRTKVKY